MENLQGGTLALEHHYHLDKRLDSFGLVTVYAGTQDPFDLPVRVAVYGGLLEADAGPDVAERIKDAAHRSSRLRSPGLLATVDFGEIEEGVPFVIERTVPGPSLSDRMEQKSVFSPDQVVELVSRLAHVLQPIHDDQLYHGCLKPEWIFFPSDDAPMDRACLAHVGISPSMSELTSMAQAVLTTDLVDAFAPESFDVAARDQGDDDDPAPRPHLSAASDQWALACTAYRLLVGVHPYFDDPVDASEGILRIKTEDPPSLSEMGIDEEIAQVIDRALHRDPQRRWPTVTAFARALDEAVHGRATSESSAETDSDPDDESTSPIVPTPQDLDEPDLATDDVELAGPGPSGYLLTIALAALLLTNLGWFFALLYDQPDDDDPDEPSVAQASEPGVLPAELMGTQIDTTPTAAQIVEIRSDGTEAPLDTTPLSVSELLDQRSRIELLLRQPGYVDHRLTIDASETRQDIQIELIADNVDG